LAYAGIIKETFVTKRVLVTGGAGFIGSHMADRLVDLGQQVIILDNESTGHHDNVPPAAHYIKGDVCNPDDLEQAFAGGLDVVFHIAGQASTVRSFDNPLSDLNTNTAGTINIIQKCLEHNVPRLLYASSMTAYGHPTQMPVPESEPCRPVSYYGISKYTAERYVHATAARTDLSHPFHVTSFRMFNVYGARQRLDNPYQGVMGIFIGNALRQETINVYGDGEQTRDFVHIADVVKAWVTAWENPAAYNQVFNLGIGQDCSMNRLIDVILEAVGQSRANYAIQYGPERPGDQRFMKANIDHIRQTLGWQPTIDLNAGISQTIEWARRYV